MFIVDPLARRSMKTVVILDWDDTLFPTDWVDVQRGSHPKSCVTTYIVALSSILYCVILYYVICCNMIYYSMTSMFDRGVLVRLALFQTTSAGVVPFLFALFQDLSR